MMAFNTDASGVVSAETASLPDNLAVGSAPSWVG